MITSPGSEYQRPTSGPDSPCRMRGSIAAKLASHKPRNEPVYKVIQGQDRRACNSRLLYPLTNLLFASGQTRKSLLWSSMSVFDFKADKTELHVDFRF